MGAGEAEHAHVVECRSLEGVIVGLIDGMIASARVVAGYVSQRDIAKVVGEALADLRSDEDVATLLPRSTLALSVEAMCHWIQNRGGVQAEISHANFQFGSVAGQSGVCPYTAVAAVLRGEPDPRDAEVPA